MNFLRNLTLFFIMFSAILTYSQDYERIDATILLYPKTVESPEQLSKFITRDFVTEEEKVRAIYSWIIENITYNPAAYKAFNFNFTNFRERNVKEEKTREKIINRTLQKGEAVCEGYAMLFEKLCEMQGISNYLVRGDIKTNFNDIGRPFKNNHVWNVAVIDDKPYLFDPTWGAGKYRGTFIKEPSYFYYKTDPELLFKTHYPSMFEDAFIDRVVSREVFSNMPLLIWEDLKINQVESPINGVLRADEYLDSIPFVISDCDVNKLSYLERGKRILIENKEIKDGRLHFNIPLTLGMKNLLVYFDEQPAMAYKIQW